MVVNPYNETPPNPEDENAQVFTPRSISIVRVGIIALLLALIGGVIIGALFWESGFITRQGIVIEQPVQFSHQHHSGQLGIHCQYCHTSVDQSYFAGFPPTHTCMSCHSQIWTNSPLLEPVRQSYATNRPIAWNKVHDLPDFVYFNHAAHVTKGVGCSTCHGPVERMQLMYQATPMTMGWCLGCHRNPEQQLRPISEIYNQGWSLPADEQRALGLQLVKEYGVRVGYITECYVCHR